MQQWGPAAQLHRCARIGCAPPACILRWLLCITFRSRFSSEPWQGVLILYGGAAGLWIAATLLGSLYIRQSLVSMVTLN